MTDSDARHDQEVEYLGAGPEGALRINTDALELLPSESKKQSGGHDSQPDQWHTPAWSIWRMLECWARQVPLAVYLVVLIYLSYQVDPWFAGAVGWAGFFDQLLDDIYPEGVGIDVI